MTAPYTSSRLSPAHLRKCKGLTSQTKHLIAPPSHVGIHRDYGVWLSKRSRALPVRTVANDYRLLSTRSVFGQRQQTCDLYVQGVPVEYLKKLVLYLQGGGVGVYPSAGFINVDDGKLRTWRGEL
jgi:hypothetical protein